MKAKQIRCPYCGGVAVLREGSYVYGEHSQVEHLYVCKNYPECDSYVGVHRGTTEPKGTLANGNLRHKRIEAHNYFDQIWKRGIMTKKNAYRWMREKFALPEKLAHIGFFSEYMCDRLIDESIKVLARRNIVCGGRSCG